MRIWCRVFLMVITLSFVACNRKKEPSNPGLEGALCLQVDSTSRYSTAIEGDSVVVTYYANDMVDTTSLHGAEVATEKLMPESKVNYTGQETETLGQVSIPGEVLMPTESPVAEKFDKYDRIFHHVASKTDSIKQIECVDTLKIIDSIDSIVLVDTIGIADEFMSHDIFEECIDLCLQEDSICYEKESYIVRRGMMHRDATASLFVPKRQWMFGGQVGWNQWNNENISYLLFENLNFKCHSFVVSPYLGYSFANNLMVGYRFSYKRGYLNVDEVGLGLGEGLSLSITDFYSVYHTYKNSLFLRSYLPIGESKIFGLLGELQLNYSFTEGKSSMGREELLQGVYQNTHTVGLGLGGGLAVFLTDFAAAEVMLNVGGCDYKWGNQSIKKIDKKDEGRLCRSNADFRIDLFSIKFGLTFYL